MTLFSACAWAACLFLLGHLIPVYADTSALGFAFNNNGAGPDGPWNCLNVSTDAPAEYVDMYPSMLETSMLVNLTACQAQSARCPQQELSLWSGSAANNLYADRNSAPWAPSEWEDMNGGYITEAMGLEGSLRYISQRITLLPKSGEVSLDGLPVAVADNLTATYANGSFYTDAVGFYSLYAGQERFTYSLPNGTNWTADNQFWLGYNKSVFPSVSYGLHLGSTMHNVSGKFFLGGYDSSRCIGTPIAATSNSSFYLSGITLGVSSGASAFLNHTGNGTEITNLLHTNTSDAAIPLPVQPDPGLPYLYLPAATCAAIAAHLPVTYSTALGLYLWNTSAPAYESIVSSPHHLSLSLSTGGSTNNTGTIAIPFALLNLTLQRPLVSTDTPYFPCRPWDPSSSSSSSSSSSATTVSGVRPQAILGRAFLQGAFLAQNWHTGTTWLAQAPGPGYGDETVKTIGVSDGDELATGGDGGGWEETWSGVLTALDESGSSDGGAGDGTGGGSVGGSGSSSGLSTGAKAGVGAGVAVGAIAISLALAGLCWRRRRRRRRRSGRVETAGRPAVSEVGGRERSPPREVDGAEAERREIDGNGVLKPEEIDGRTVEEIDGRNVAKSAAVNGNTPAELP